MRAEWDAYHTLVIIIIIATLTATATSAPTAAWPPDGKNLSATPNDLPTSRVNSTWRHDSQGQPTGPGDLDAQGPPPRPRPPTDGGGRLPDTPTSDATPGIGPPSSANDLQGGSQPGPNPASNHSHSNSRHTADNNDDDNKKQDDALHPSPTTNIDDYLDSNLIPTPTPKLETLYERNVIPNVRYPDSLLPTKMAALLPAAPSAAPNPRDAGRPEPLGVPRADNQTEEDSEAGVAQSVRGQGIEPQDLTDLREYDVEVGWEHAPKAPSDARVLRIHLENEDHSVLVTWQVLQDIPRLSGFVVSYKMEGREDYDSSKLGRNVRRFTLHSLHEDKEYAICVLALANETHVVLEACTGWSQASTKLYVGIIAGCTLLVPCALFLLYILYKDKTITRRVKMRLQQSLASENQACLLVAPKENGHPHGHTHVKSRCDSYSESQPLGAYALEAGRTTTDEDHAHAHTHAQHDQQPTDAHADAYQCHENSARCV